MNTHLYTVSHYWGADGDAPSVYYVQAAHVPTDAEVIAALDIDFEAGERLLIERIKLDALLPEDLSAITPEDLDFAESLALSEAAAPAPAPERSQTPVGDQPDLDEDEIALLEDITRRNVRKD